MSEARLLTREEFYAAVVQRTNEFARSQRMPQITPSEAEALWKDYLRKNDG